MTPWLEHQHNLYLIGYSLKLQESRTRIKGTFIGDGSMFAPDGDILWSIPIHRAVAFQSNTFCVKATPSSPWDCYNMQSPPWEYLKTQRNLLDFCRVLKVGHWSYRAFRLCLQRHQSHLPWNSASDHCVCLHQADSSNPECCDDWQAENTMAFSFWPLASRLTCISSTYNSAGPR